MGTEFDNTIADNTSCFLKTITKLTKSFIMIMKNIVLAAMTVTMCYATSEVGKKLEDDKSKTIKVGARVSSKMRTKSKEVSTKFEQGIIAKVHPYIPLSVDIKFDDGEFQSNLSVETFCVTPEPTMEDLRNKVGRQSITPKDKNFLLSEIAKTSTGDNPVSFLLSALLWDIDRLREGMKKLRDNKILKKRFQKPKTKPMDK